MNDARPHRPGHDALDEEALIAAVDLVGRCGATEFEVNYAGDERVNQPRWWAAAKLAGARVQVENQRDPVAAAEALAARMLHGGWCVGCGKLIAINDEPIPVPARQPDGSPVDEVQIRRRGQCHWQRQGARWMRGCGESAPAGSTREKLARAMADAGCAAAGIRQARAGYYDEYLSPLPLPLVTLVNDLRANGHHALAQRVDDGEFDATKEESGAWAASLDGREAFASLLDGTLLNAAREAAGQNTPPDGEGSARPPWRSKRSGKKPKRRR